MGKGILILGDSGTGKTYSARNFQPDEALIIQGYDKFLPFKAPVGFRRLPLSVNQQDNEQRQIGFTAQYDMLKKYLEVLPKSEKPIHENYPNKKVKDINTYIIDDSQFLMSFEQVFTATKGYDKYTDIAKKFLQIVVDSINRLPPNKIVYFLHHTEKQFNNDAMFEKAKTVGKMIDNFITLEALFTIVLKAKKNQSGKHVFATVTNGYDTVKCPPGIFDEEEIPNDLKLVDTKIREFLKEELERN